MVEDAPLQIGKYTFRSRLFVGTGKYPSIPVMQAAHAAPRAGREECLAAVWVEVLKDRVPGGQVGRHDNFFSLGGDSLLAIRIVNRAREVGLVFTVLQLFERSHQRLGNISPAIRAKPSRHTYR